MRRALLPAVKYTRPALILIALAVAASSPQGAPAEAQAATPAPATPAPAATAAPATPPAAIPPSEAPAEIVVEAPEPRYVARTTRDRIGRIWAPVLIDGKGPFRLVLDTGATHSAVIPSTVTALGKPQATSPIMVTGFTGQAIVPTISVQTMEVGELLLGPTKLPVVPDVFGGAQGVLGPEGLQGKRIFADFSHDRLVISRSHGDAARPGFNVVPFKLIEGLPIADIRVGGTHCKAIIDTGAQGTVGNLPLRQELSRHPPRAINRTDIEGVTLDVQTGDTLPAPQIEMGGLTMSGAHIIFGDMYLFQHWHMTEKPVLLLGMDVLGSFDVLIVDYRMHELQIQLAR